MKILSRRLTALLVAGAVACSYAALPAAAAWDFSPSGSAIVRTAPALTVTGGIQGTNYTYQDGQLKVLQGDLTITGSGTAVDATIQVNPGYTGTLTLENVNLKSTTLGAALGLKSTSNVTVRLIGENTLQAADAFAGVQLSYDCAVTLTGPGSLTARGGVGGAGIGGGQSGSSGNVTLDGCTVHAIGGGGGAADLGAGASSIADGEVFITGNALVYADTITDQSNQNSWQGLVVGDTAATVYGNLTLTGDLTLDDTTPLVVPEGATLTVPEGVELLVSQLENNGTLTVAEGGIFSAEKVENTGTLAVAEGGIFSAEETNNTGTLENAGTTALGTTQNGGEVTNTGRMTVANGTFTNDGTLDNDGTLGLYTAPLINNGELVCDGTLELNDSTLTTADGAALDGDGSLILARGGALQGPSALNLTQEYRIYFDAGEGTASPESAVTENGRLTTLPEAEREGYALTGWFLQQTDSQPVTEESVFTASTTLYARWEVPATPTPSPVVTPTPEPTATATPVPTVTPTAQPTAKPTSAPTPTAASKPTATAAPQAAAATTPSPTAAPTATPSATPVPMRTLHFNTMGGLQLGDVQFGLGAPVELWPYTPVRMGYLFAGWYADEALTKPVSTIVLVQDTTIYAKWTPDPAAQAAATSGSGSSGSGKGSGSSQGGSAKATATPEPTQTPTPTPTVTPTPEPTATPEPTEAPADTEADSTFPVVPVAGGILVVAAAVIGGIVVVRKRGGKDGHYHHR